MADCLFCKIIQKEIPSEIIHQDDDIIIFKDINPSAPVHLLVVPNKHIPSVTEMTPIDEIILGKLFSGAKRAAENIGIDKTGYRLIVNNGPDAHQEIFHIHMHLLGGGEMKHPMG
ncbi:MAG: HIT domain-containing protein [Anaerolineales bacterium]